MTKRDTSYDSPAQQRKRAKRDAYHNSFLTAGIVKNGWFWPFNGSCPHYKGV